LQILDSCAKSLQTHAAIIEAIAETLRGDADDHDESGKEKINKSSLLVAQIKDAATGMEELRDVKVSHSISSFLPFLVALLRFRHMNHCIHSSCLDLVHVVIHITKPVANLTI